MGGRRECIIGTKIGDRKNVVAPDAKAICCVSQDLSLLLLSSIMLPLLFFWVISLVVANARSLRLLLLFFCFSFCSLSIREESDRDTVETSKVALADAMTSSSISRVISDGAPFFSLSLLFGPSHHLLLLELSADILRIGVGRKHKASVATK